MTLNARRSNAPGRIAGAERTPRPPVEASPPGEPYRRGKNTGDDRLDPAARAEPAPYRRDPHPAARPLKPP